MRHPDALAPTTDNPRPPVEPVPESGLLDVAGVASRAGVPLRMARRLLDERRLPTVKIGRYVRVRPDDLDAWLAAQTRPAVER